MWSFAVGFEAMRFDKADEVSSTIDSGKSKDTFKSLKQQLTDIRKRTKDEHDEVKKRLRDADADMKD